MKSKETGLAQLYFSVTLNLGLESQKCQLWSQKGRSHLSFCKSLSVNQWANSGYDPSWGNIICEADSESNK